MIRHLIILIFLSLAFTSCKNPLGDAGSTSNTFCAGNTDQAIDEQCNLMRESTKETIRSWDFLADGDYSFDSNYIEVTAGRANLKLANQSHIGDVFNNGNFVGTRLDENNKIVIKNKPTSSETNINTILPSKSSNLLGYWRFDSSFNDSSANGNDGTSFNGCNISSDSKLGSGAANFDGTDDYIKTGLVQNNISAYSIQAWVKTTNSNQIFIHNRGRESGSSGKSITLGMGTSSGGRGGPGRPFIMLDSIGVDIGISANITINDGKWHHVVGTWSASSGTSISNTQFNLYINGAEVSTVSSTVGSEVSPLTGLDFTEIGGHSASSDYYEGAMDEVAIWDTELSAEEVFSLYQAQNINYTELSSSWTPAYDNIAGYWKMDGNWLDSSGNENHGVAQADATFTTLSKVGSYAGTFDGVGDHVLVANSTSLNPSTSVSLGAWIRRSTEGTQDGILEKYNWSAGSGSYVMRIQNDKLSGTVINGTSPSPSLSCQSIKKIMPHIWYHVVFVYDGSTTKVHCYVNGTIEDTSITGVALKSSSTSLKIGARGDDGSNTFDGILDEIVIWNTALSSVDVKKIYDRQKQKYAGHYDSPIVDLGKIGEWTNIDVITSLPFGKEIVAQSTEHSSDYSDLNGNLHNNLLSYWSFSEQFLNGYSSGGDFRDQTSNEHILSESGGVSLIGSSFLNRGVSFDGIDDNLNSGNSSFLPYGSSNRTVSLWIKPSTLQSRSLFGYGTQSAMQAFEITIVASGNIGVHWVGNNVSSQFPNSKYSVGEWQHITASYDGSEAKVYINGVLSDSFSIALNTIDSSEFNIGSGVYSPIDFFKGEIDEVAIWSRVLNPTEILQIYRRGANRVKYQLKSCIDSSCECKAYSTTPVGNANDCDGDGIPNSSDTDDVFLAKFIGPGGDGSTQYSEMFNRNPSNLFFNCTANTSDTDNNVCVDDEITFEGDTNSTTPSFVFNDMSLSAVPSNNRYFQYRVLMEAEENTACSGEPCLPDLTSVELGPTGRYYGGSPVISSNSPFSYNNIISLTFTEGGSCSPTYQLSPDGSTYYYYDGASWMIAGFETVSMSSTSNQISSNINSFTGTAGLGNLYFKAFLKSDTTQSCRLDKISLSKKAD